MLNQMQSRTSMVPDALQALMVLSKEASPMTPQGMPTVAAQKAQEASGIMQGMGGMPASPMQGQAPGIQQAAMRSAQAQQPVTQAQLAQAMQPQQRAMQGVAGLPAQNMQGFREGGIIGFSGEERSDVPETELPVSDRIKRALRNWYERTETGFMERAGVPPEIIAKKLGKTPPAPVTPAPEGSDRRIDLPPGGIVSPGMAPAPVAPPVPAPRPPGPGAAPTQRPPATAQAPSGIAQLPARVGVDTSGIQPAGNEFLIRATEYENRMKDVAEKEERARAGMPDLSASGIQALEAARAKQRALFEEEQSDAARQRMLGVLAGVTGRDRGAYDRVVAQQMAARKAEVNADLLHQQAVLKLQEAQQAKALGQFDRERQLIKEAERIMGEAQKNKLTAQRIATDIATTGATIGSQQRGQDIQRQTSMEQIAANERLEMLRRQTSQMPGPDQKRMEELERLKLQQLTGGNPPTVEQQLEAKEYAINTVRGGGAKAESQQLLELKALQQNLQKQSENMLLTPERKAALQAQLEQVNASIAKMAGIGSIAPTGAPAVGTVMQGYRFKGGNPADRNNWEKV